VRVFETALKVAVGLIVLCFIAVVVRLTFAENSPLDWGAVFSGFVPNPGTLFDPAPALQSLLDAVPAGEARDYWTAKVKGDQRDQLMAAFATAVGINMTFLLPYSMLGRGWGREHRGLSVFDLATGMFIPFFLATTCVVIASASQFHGQPRAGVKLDDAGYAALLENDKPSPPEGAFLKNVEGRVAAIGGDAASLPAAERVLASTLVARDSDALAKALRPVFGGRAFGDVIFGLGVIGMALSTICLLMLVSGFVVCEVLNVPATGWTFRLGSLLPAIGVLGPFVWSSAGFYLAVPTSVAGLVLLPAAYVTFLLLMNKKELLGAAMPTGGKRIAVNAVLGFATAVSLFAAGWAVRDKMAETGVVSGEVGLALVVVALAVVLTLGYFTKQKATPPT
jgi:hypothetical protein